MLLTDFTVLNISEFKVFGLVSLLKFEISNVRMIFFLLFKVSNSRMFGLRTTQRSVQWIVLESQRTLSFTCQEKDKISSRYKIEKIDKMIYLYR